MPDLSSIREGMLVHDSRGEVLGRVTVRREHAFFVQRGNVVHETVAVTTAVVEEIRDGEIWLSVDRATLLTQHQRDPEQKDFVEVEGPDSDVEAAGTQEEDRRPRDEGDVAATRPGPSFDR